MYHDKRRGQWLRGPLPANFFEKKQVKGPQPSTSRSSSPILVYGISVCASFFAAFLIYYFVFHDSWDVDNFSHISSRCKAIHSAVAKHNDGEATQIYNELIQFIGEHEIKQGFIAETIQAAREAQLQCQREVQHELQEEKKARKEETVASLQTIRQPFGAARCVGFWWFSRAVVFALHVACPRQSAH